MRLQLRSALFLLEACCVLVWAAEQQPPQQDQSEEELPLIQGVPIISSQARAARIAEFVTSHKIPDSVRRKDARLYDDEEEQEDEEEAGQARVDLENFGSTGLLYEDEAAAGRRSSGQHVRLDARQDRDETLAGVRVSSENPTTMLPVLTTQRDSRPFDFVPVNIIREDAKGSPFAAFDNKNFEDLGDVPLIPAGSNTRIQVKKGPNGKDYEYEYVYYYYDEDEDEGKGGGATASNSQEAPTRTSAPNSPAGSRRGSNRNKYSTLERTTTTTSTTTVEPVINEVIPSGNGNRARQLESGHEEVADERLPTNTRFPPRSRGGHAVETTERSSRTRGNRQRPALDAVDSSSFRGHQDGPEFPQNLPNGPVRFLGVTPNEGNDEAKTSGGQGAGSRARGRPQRVQEPAPVQESYDEPVFSRKRPVAAQYETGEQHERGQTHARQPAHTPRDEDEHSSARPLPDDRDSYTEAAGDVTEAPTTQVPHAMDKVALDLYAFLQQGRSNLVDFVKEADDSAEGTDSSAEAATTEATSAEGTTTLSAADADDQATGAPTTTPGTTTTTSTTTTTTTTPPPPPPSSSEEPSTAQPAFGRGKFKRPGLGGPAISRNRFKSHAAAVSTTTEAPAAEGAAPAGPTPRSRGRFGSASGPGAGGFKRARPGQKQQPQPAVEEPAQKESADKVSAEAKPAAGRGRYRGTSARSGPHARTTPAPTTPGDKPTSAATPAAAAAAAPAAGHRPAFGKLPGLNRRRGGRPGAPAAAAAAAAPAEEAAAAAPEQPAPESSPAAEPPTPPLKKPAAAGPRPKPLAKPIIKPGAGRLNLRPRPGQQPSSSSTTTEAPADALPAADGTVDEPASEGTEEETREAPAESSPPAKPTTVNPLNKLRNRNKLQVHPKTTTARTPLPPAARRSHLLPRRKTTEAPPPPAAEPEAAPEDDEPQSEEAPATEAAVPAAAESSPPPRHEEARGLSSLLAPRRRIAPRRPGQPIAPAAE